MPQLMPLNWMFFMLMMGFLMVVCFYLYCFKVVLWLNILDKCNFKIKNNWLW